MRSRADRKAGESADNSSPEALYKQGAAYYFGESVDEKFAKAAEYYRKAAEQGYAQAQSELGVMYEKGEGVPQSYAEALGWYRTAADKGYPQAQVNLGICPRTGAASIKTSLRPSRCTARPRNRDTPWGSLISQTCITTAQACNKITPRPPNGIAGRPTRATRRRSSS